MALNSKKVARPWARGGAADCDRGDDRVNPQNCGEQAGPRAVSPTQGPRARASGRAKCAQAK